MGNICGGSSTVEHHSSYTNSAAHLGVGGNGNVMKNSGGSVHDHGAKVPRSPVAMRNGDVMKNSGSMHNHGPKVPPSPVAMRKGDLDNKFIAVDARAGSKEGGGCRANDIMKARASPAAPIRGIASLDGSIAQIGKIVTPNLKIYTFAELKAATRNFKPDTLLGEGGFGRVFKGWIDPNTLAPCKVAAGIPVAVKKCSPDSVQGVKEWNAEVNLLGKFSHPNLVKLIGYCTEERELLLVYEYLPKGSLENHLFKKHVEPPPWGLRMKIAMDAARGLYFLHTTENTVIYRDFKPSNILLDQDFNAKLSDFGLARLGPANGSSHVTTQAVGTYGYAAPEYISTGHLYVKSDVYGFGVVLLEILTGLKAYDLDRPTAQINLVKLHRPILVDRNKLKKIIDPRLSDNYPPEGAQKLAQLIYRCLENDPRHRPAMSEALIILERISTIIWKPKKTTPPEPPRSSPRAPEHNLMDGRLSPFLGRPGHTGPLRTPRDMR
ncbi:putative serine/threonine-protein kinase CST [Drosera capensis]